MSEGRAGGAQTERRAGGAQTNTLSAALSGISLPDGEGQEIRLGSLWQESPAVLVFLRHYG